MALKIGGTEHIDEGAASLIALSGKIDTGRMLAPSFMAENVLLVGKKVWCAMCLTATFADS